MKTISSSLTYFMKYYLIPVWTLIALALYFLLKDLDFLELEAIHYFILWLTIDVVIFFNMFSIKEVSIDEEKKQIHVSNLRKQRCIRFRMSSMFPDHVLPFQSKCGSEPRIRRLPFLCRKCAFLSFSFTVTRWLRSLLICVDLRIGRSQVMI